MRLYFLSSLALTLTLVLTTSCQEAKPVARSAPTAVRDTFWVDVRTPGEHAAGNLAQSSNIPLQEFEKAFRASIPDTNAVVALYCRSGNRSGQALRLAQQWGYRKAFNAGSYSELSKNR